MKKTYIIAEIGINHMGDMNKAKQLIDAASRSGVDAVKFQTYITEKRVPLDSPIFDILKKCELPFESFKELKEYCDLKNIEFFSTPFDIESVDYLKSIGIIKYKIASFDVTNHSLLEYISNNAFFVTSIIMSTGMANLQEVKEAYNILKKRCHVSLLHCVSAYPRKEIDANLNIIKTLKENFPQCTIGHSDHTPDIKVPLYAVACGAEIIEKHFMIEPDCVDAPVSINEKQMSLLVKEIRLLEKILGNKSLGMTKAQEGTKIFRRSEGSKII